VSQVTLARTKACIFWTTIPATIADTSATRVLHLEPVGRAPRAIGVAASWVLPVFPLPFIPVQYRWHFDHSDASART
jgi:hypothetical protein